MANNLSITLTTDAGAVTTTSTEITSAQMDKVVDFFWTAYPQFDESDPPEPLPDTPANRAKAVKDGERGIIRGVKNNVIRDLTKKRDAAQTPIDDIEL